MKDNNELKILINNIIKSFFFNALYAIVIDVYQDILKRTPVTLPSPSGYGVRSESDIVR